MLFLPVNGLSALRSKKVPDFNGSRPTHWLGPGLGRYGKMNQPGSLPRDVPLQGNLILEKGVRVIEALCIMSLRVSVARASELCHDSARIAWPVVGAGPGWSPLCERMPWSQPCAQRLVCLWRSVLLSGPFDDAALLENVGDEPAHEGPDQAETPAGQDVRRVVNAEIDAAQADQDRDQHGDGQKV